MQRPVIRYHGGKFGSGGSVARRIAGLFPPHRVYVEPFGGAASVLMQKPRSYAEIYNDRYDGVVNVFRVLRDPEASAELERRLRLTPFARAEFEQCTAADIDDLDDDVEKARRIIFRAFSGFGSAASNPTYNTGFRSSSNRSGTTPAHDWRNYPDHIAAFTRRLQGVVIENADACVVMQRHDCAEALHYVDPPYVHSTRRLKRRGYTSEYLFEMTDEDHEALAGVLSGLAGMVVLSGYQSDLYGRLFAEWQSVEFTALADGASSRTEVLWLNEAAWQRCHMDRDLFAGLASEVA